MEVTGRERRLQRLFSPSSGRTVILPIDQPVSLGPLDGIRDVDAALPQLLSGEPDALLAHRGVVRRVPTEQLARTGLIMHLSAGTRLSGRAQVKVLTGTVEEAVRLGADAVSLQVTFGTEEEPAMLADLAHTVGSCDRWGIPLLVMVYVHQVDPTESPDLVAHAARVAAEFGCDVVKVPWTGAAESFATVVSGCFVPVVVAGGERVGNWDAVQDIVKGAIAAGATGVCIGRNVFQHPNPRRAMAEVRAYVHDAATSDVGRNGRAS